MKSLVSRQKPPPRLTRKRWIGLGLELLKTRGPDALTVEQLCKFAGKTRGSFYFHFHTIEDFFVAIAASWKVEFTDRITQATGMPPAFERLDLLNRLAARLDPGIELGMRHLAARHKSVALLVAEADQARIRYLSALYRRTGKFTDSSAGALAKIEVAALVGLQQIAPQMTPEQSRAIYTEFLKLTGRA